MKAEWGLKFIGTYESNAENKIMLSYWFTYFQYLKEIHKKDEGRLFSRSSCNRSRSNHFKLKDVRLRLVIKEENVYSDHCEILEQTTQRDDRCVTPGNIQGQAGWCSEQSGLFEDVSAHCRKVGLED